MLRPRHASSLLTSPTLPALGLLCSLLAPLAACQHRQLNVAPDVLAVTPPAVIDQVRADPYNYFRLTNREWTARVCEIFAGDLPTQPVVQLHGDAHVEQFAFMTDSWGLDDFDDAARGPALVDIVRFLGSVDLAARGRGWSHDRDRLFDRFFEGYRKGLSDPDYQPPEPDVVRHHRSEVEPMSREAFLAWAEAKMQPMADGPRKSLSTAMRVFSDLVREGRPDLPAGYFDIVRAGWLQIGVGSSMTLKVLMRLEGRTGDRADDVLLEAKAVRPHGQLPCLEESLARPTFRILQGSRQVGRLKHDILAAGPELANTELTIQGQHVRDWWIRSWDPSYHEIERGDLRSVDDLSDLTYDSGVQLAAGALHGALAADHPVLSRRLIDTIARSEPELRRAAVRLVQELLRGWRNVGGE